MNEINLQTVLSVYVERYTGAAFRGLIILGSLYLLFWLIKPKAFQKFRVQPPTNQNPKPLKEAFLTFTTYLVYAAASSLVFLIYMKTGYIKAYNNVADMGWFYTIASFFVFLFYTDMMFYWSHFLMHRSRFLYKTHSYHHQFVNVTPWAAYAFHTGEAIINAAAFLILMLVVPWHPVVLLLFVIVSIAYNGYIHSGYDFTPLAWRSHPVFKWLNSPTHHIYHHQKLNCNYSFLFTFWDKWMGTEVYPELRKNHSQPRDKDFLPDGKNLVSEPSSL
jgi:lathosterol oxidase